MFELARLASDPASSRGSAWQLAATPDRCCALDPSLDPIVAGVDAKLLRALRGRGWSFEQLGDPLVHLDSSTAPIRIDLAAARIVLESFR